jgi:putative endonuclease
MAPHSKTYYVYMLANRSGSLYIGVTGDLFKRLWQHRSDHGCAFTSKYKLTKLLWFEETDDVSAALAREKQLKNWRRQWKVDLIDSMNRAWVDLAAGWYERARRLCRGSAVARVPAPPGIDPESSSG